MDHAAKGLSGAPRRGVPGGGCGGDGPLRGRAAGTWGNVDSLTAGWGKIRIAVSATGGLDVYGHGVCDPSYCERGPTPLLVASMPPRYEPEWAVAIWNQAPLMTVMIFTREGGFLVVEVFTYWTDGTGMPLREIALLRQIEWRARSKQCKFAFSLPQAVA